ncbi:MAG: hypothetical protein QM730_18025 [Anaerolineales bacterium]
MREYPKLKSKDTRLIGRRADNGIESQLLVIQTPFGYRRMAEMICPEGKEPIAAILYVHWYEPEFA